MSFKMGFEGPVVAHEAKKEEKDVPSCATCTSKSLNKKVESTAQNIGIGSKNGNVCAVF